MPTQLIHRVIVKFKDKVIGCEPDNMDKKFKNFLPELRASNEWKALTNSFPGITIKQLITAMSQEQLLQLRNKAVERDPSCMSYAPNLLSYFVIPCPPSVNAENLAKALSSAETWKSRGVMKAYVEGRLSLPMIENPGKNPDWKLPDTGFLREAPRGIDAESAWKFKGGDGGQKEGINLQFVDIERNWDFTHPDLPPSNGNIINLICGTLDQGNVSATDHGTGVLGIVVGQDNNLLGLGVTPNVARISVASCLNGPELDIPNAIAEALKQMNDGDVLLLEMQIDRDGMQNLPVEYDRHIFELIQSGTKTGKVIVEAAGNNRYDLDNLPIATSWLTRLPGADDSEAIMVSAATSTVPHEVITVVDTNPPVRVHNFGTRVDCYAWGEDIYTTKSGGTSQNFGGTSGAAAIVAGAALSTQGMAEALNGTRLSPSALRALLSDPSGNTQSKDPPNDKIGVMPNLKWIRSQL
jgi:subtilase family protein